MGAVQTVRDPQDAAQLTDQFSVIGGHAGEVRVRPLGKRPAVVAGHVGNELHLTGRERRQIAMDDQVVGVLVVLRVADEIADVVQ
jgi:hypothetical protein